jgi:hypothetical protein
MRTAAAAMTVLLLITTKYSQQPELPSPLSLMRAAL